MADHSPTSAPSLARGRIYIVLAALVWSTSGAFTKILTQPTAFGAYPPPVEPLHWNGKDYPVQLAAYRALFAGIVLMATVRPRDIAYRPLMIGMAVCFALMNITFVSAQALGTAANAIFLQYSAPLWMYLAAVFWLGEASDRRSTIALVFGLLGIAVIVVGGWEEGELLVIGFGLGCGVAAGV